MSGNRIRLNVYGKRIDVERVDGEWIAYYKGPDGKRRKADDIVVPADIHREQMLTYIADLLHEWATDRHPNVEMLD